MRGGTARRLAAGLVDRRPAAGRIGIGVQAPCRDKRPLGHRHRTVPEGRCDDHVGVMVGDRRDRWGRRSQRNAAQDRGEAERRQEPAGGPLDDPDQAALEALHLAGV